jgi:hypothetical protein
MKVNSGNDMQARQMGGDGAGATGSATSPTSTGFTTSGLAAGPFVGHLVFLGGVYGVVTASTSTSVTVDQWYTPGSPGGAAASTPGAGTFVISPGNSPAPFMALGNTNTSPVNTDTTMSGEITTSGGGLKRQLAVYSHTTGVAGYTLTGTFTANGSDSLPVTAYRIGVFNSIVPAGGHMQFETLLSAPATFNASGDQLVVTESVAN